MIKEILVITNLLSLSLISCSTIEPPDPPPPPVVDEPVLTLELDDAHCTEAWLQLTTKDLELPAELTLKQYNPTGDSLAQIFILNTQDSLLYIDSLLPNQTYKFKVAANTTNLPQSTTNLLNVTTMDTTSHNFSFEMVTFGGQIGSSVLYDVAIINENNIWAVGEIWIADTSSLGYTKYNAVHWDGSQWELKKIMFYTICGQPYTGAYPAKSAWIISENEIWIALDGNQIAKIVNGIQVATICLPLNIDMSINKIWGTSSNDLYIVGNSGNIAHYNGSSWTKIESNTTLNINDIWGDYNEKTQEWEVLAVASNIFSGFEKDVLKINPAGVELLNKDGIEESLSGLWFISGRKYYLVGSGTYEKKSLRDLIWEGDPLDITEYFENGIKANNINDIIIVCAFGEVLHYNGIEWKDYQNDLELFNGAYRSLDIKNNLFIAVGYESTMAKILIGRR